MSHKDKVPAAGQAAGTNPIVIGVAVAAIVGAGVLAFWRPQLSPPQDAAAVAPALADQSPAAPPPAPPPPPQPDEKAIAKADANAKLGPHKQDRLPPIPFAAYAPPRPHEVVTTAYQFAAEHPEILSYVPCFCGCENAGHSGNHDCFVKSRAPNGDVVEWDEHGVECTVCIDVANRSRQLDSSGATARDIRAAIDREFGARGGTRMATPHPH